MTARDVSQPMELQPQEKQLRIQNSIGVHQHSINQNVPRHQRIIKGEWGVEREFYGPAISDKLARCCSQPMLLADAVR